MAGNFKEPIEIEPTEKRRAQRLCFGHYKCETLFQLASGEFPDIIEWNNWPTFPGGPEKAIDDGYIVKLNDLIATNSPNLKKVLKDKVLDKMVKTDSGKYFVYPNVRGDEMLLVFTGPFLRQDWLTELGLQPPTTIDEWYTVLKAFKEKKKADSPLVFRYDLFNSHNTFVGAFGTTHDFYLDKGKVKFGPMQPGYKNFLITFRKWYAEGLVSKDLAMVNQKILDSKMLGGASGACIANSGNGIGKYLDSMKKKDPKYDLVAVPYPTLKKGEQAKFGQRENKYSRNGNAAITKASKNKELAAKWLDYGYSDEGHMLFNFGIPDISYTMIKGYPTYTALVTKSPEGLTMSQALGKYTRGFYNGPFVQDKRYFEQFSMSYPQQKNAIEVWKKTDQAKYQLPLITPTSAESDEMARIMSEIYAYRDETVMKIIMGQEPIENYEKFVAQLKKMGIEKAIAINQSALKRYTER